jgi:hypothetical protein
LLVCVCHGWGFLLSEGLGGIVLGRERPNARVVWPSSTLKEAILQAHAVAMSGTSTGHPTGDQTRTRSPGRLGIAATPETMSTGRVLAAKSAQTSLLVRSSIVFRSRADGRGGGLRYQPGSKQSLLSIARPAALRVRLRDPNLLCARADWLGRRFTTTTAKTTLPLLNATRRPPCPPESAFRQDRD